MAIFLHNGKEYLIFTGKNKNHNFELIDAATASDLWFHIAGVPSAHVILRTMGEARGSIPHAVIKRCARFCVEKSKLNSKKSIPVIYTEIANVEKTAIVGQVQVRGTPYRIDVNI